MKNIIIKIVILVLVFVVGMVLLFTSKPSKEKQSQYMQNNELPFPLISNEKDFSSVLHTEEGDITIDLFENITPITVSNFVSLARAGFYSGTVFHRVISGFMIQGGDPKGNGTGGPGYSFPDEPFSGEYVRGVLAMANSGPDTNGSQFFIMQSDVALSKNYVIFGKVVNGIDVVDEIANAKTLPNPNMPGEMSLPEKPIKIISVEIFEK